MACDVKISVEWRSCFVSYSLGCCTYPSSCLLPRFNRRPSATDVLSCVSSQASCLSLETVRPLCRFCRPLRAGKRGARPSVEQTTRFISMRRSERVTSSNAIVTRPAHKTPLTTTQCFLFTMQRFLCLSAFAASFLALRMATAEETTFRKPSFCHGLDCPIYTVVEKTSEYEVRKYAACVFSFIHVDLNVIVVGVSQMGFDHD